MLRDWSPRLYPCIALKTKTKSHKRTTSIVRTCERVCVYARMCLCVYGGVSLWVCWCILLISVCYCTRQAPSWSSTGQTHHTCPQLLLGVVLCIRNWACECEASSVCKLWLPPFRTSLNVEDRTQYTPLVLLLPPASGMSEQIIIQCKVTPHQWTLSSTGLFVMNVWVGHLGERRTVLIGAMLMSLSAILSSLANDMMLIICLQGGLLGK